MSQSSGDKFYWLNNNVILQQPKIPDLDNFLGTTVHFKSVDSTVGMDFSHPGAE